MKKGNLLFIKIFQNKNTKYHSLKFNKTLFTLIAFHHLLQKHFRLVVIFMLAPAIGVLQHHPFIFFVLIKLKFLLEYQILLSVQELTFPIQLLHDYIFHYNFEVVVNFMLLVILLLKVVFLNEVLIYGFAYRRKMDLYFLLSLLFLFKL